MTQTTSAAATLEAARTAERAICGQIHAVADALDSLGRQPVQTALERLGQAIDNTRSRLAQAREDARDMLAGAFLDFSDLAGDFLASTPEPLALPAPAATLAQDATEPVADPTPIVVAPVAQESAQEASEPAVATAANPPAAEVPTAPLAEVQAPLTVAKASRLPKAELRQMAQESGLDISDEATKSDIVAALENAGLLS